MGGFGHSTGEDQDIDGATAAQNNGYAFTDVRIFDASGSVHNANRHGYNDGWTYDFLGNIKINAILTDNIVDKYLNLADWEQELLGLPLALPTGNAHLDDVEFVYDLGANNDVLDIAISAANLVKAGTTTFADFSLNIYGEAGNDLISTAIYDGGISDLHLANATDATPWYINSQLNANLYINAGDGNDTVNTFGSGDWIIDLGKGNDTYYADNAGHLDDPSYGISGSTGRATWVFNTANQDRTKVLGTDTEAEVRVLDALVSDDNDAQWLFGTKVRVTFKDAREGTFISSYTPIPNSQYRTSDQQINQAIKAAIAFDPVLSKLLIAEDSVGSILTVRALSDGAHVVGDLEVSFVAPTAAELTLGDVASFKQAYITYAVAHGTPRATAEAAVNFTDTAGLASFIATQLAGADGNQVRADYLSVLAGYNDAGIVYTDSKEITGTDSMHHTSDNLIDAGESSTWVQSAHDGDVIVLSTGECSNDTIKWSGVVDGKAIDNGLNTVVNFVDASDATYTAAARITLNLTNIVNTGANIAAGTEILSITLSNGAVFTASSPLSSGAVTDADIAAVFSGLSSTGTTGWTASVTGTTVTFNQDTRVWSIYQIQ
ncbi:hypothetical protein AGMMS50256_35850 [Betaproteobacteria bacterium]|nr:hypothetical protein AGMMS50256_35850 [Betaproteobacteria bacterium]